MPRPRKTPDKSATKAMDDGLNSLFGALSDAIEEMVTRLEDGTAGAVVRDQVFQTPKGPIRAHAGVRLRMGGVDIHGAQDASQPINPDRPRRAPQGDAYKPLAYDVLEDEVDWIITADLPGVSRKELQLAQNDTSLSITTTGERRYAADVDLGGAFRGDDVVTTLRNGILTLQISKADPS